MDMSVQCTSCRTTYRVPEAMAGKRVKCKKCGSAFSIPAPPTTTAAPDPGPEEDPLAAMMAMERDAAPVEVAPALPPLADTASPPPLSAPPAPSAPPPLPASRGTPISAMRSVAPPPAAAGSGPRLGAFRLGGFHFSRFTIALVFLGGMLLFFGYREARLAAASSDTPKPITCAELESNGPGDNAHIVLSKFVFEPRGTVYKYEKQTSRWNTIWVPVVAMTSAPVLGGPPRMTGAEVDETGDVPPPVNGVRSGRVKVIVKSSAVHGLDDLRRYIQSHPTIQGMVVNRIESLGSEERRLLNQAFPGTDFTTCWIIEEGRQPAGAGKMAAFFGGGLILLLGGLALMFRARD